MNEGTRECPGGCLEGGACSAPRVHWAHAAVPSPARDAIPASRMDPATSPLSGLPSTRSPRMSASGAFVDAFPANARVSEPALPLLLRDAPRRPEARARLPCSPRTRRRATSPTQSGWYTDPSRVALLPSRGVRAGSGLDPPAHLVGERVRALDVLGRGGVVCVSARALAEGMPAARERPERRPACARRRCRPRRARRGAGARGLRARRASREKRGQIAVRGRLVDIFPSTGREPLRVEFFGDEIEQIRAFSPFTQRALHPVDDAVVFPAREATRSAAETALLDGAETDLVPFLDRTPDLVWQVDDVLSLWQEEGLDAPSVERRRTARRSPALAAACLRGAAPGDRGARARRGRERACRDARSRDVGSS